MRYDFQFVYLKKESTLSDMLRWSFWYNFVFQLEYWNCQQLSWNVVSNLPYRIILCSLVLWNELKYFLLFKLSRIRQWFFYTTYIVCRYVRFWLHGIFFHQSWHQQPAIIGSITKYFWINRNQKSTRYMSYKQNYQWTNLAKFDSQQ